MDKRLNIFFSYDRGGYKDPDKLKQLEDNVTRSFIIVLRHLQPRNQSQLLKKLLGPNNYFGLKYDLQNLKKRSDLKLNSTKYLLTIGSVESEYRKEHLEKSNIQRFQFEKISEDKDDKSKKVFKKIIYDISSLLDGDESKLASHLRKFENDYNYKFEKVFDNGINKDRLESHLVYLNDFLKGCRPDAWIYNDHLSIAIESKIGSNPFIESQLCRHIRDKTHGLGVKANEKFYVINTTWDNLAEIFKSLKIYNSKNYSVEKFLIDQFEEYIYMNKKVLNLSFITEGSGYDRENAKEQFPLLLAKLDEKIKKPIMKFGRADRPLSDYIWDYYGLKDSNEKVKQDPHYSVYFDEDFAGIALTTKNKNQMKFILDRKWKEKFYKKRNEKFDENHKEKFDDFVGNILKLESNKRSRYYLNLVNYRLMDWKKGRQKGKTFETFNFELNFSELKNIKEEKVDDEISSLKKQFLDLSKYSKQFEFGIRILYPYGEIKKGDEALMRGQNKDLFNNVDQLLDMYSNFIENTSEIFKELVELKVKR